MKTKIPLYISTVFPSWADYQVACPVSWTQKLRARFGYWLLRLALRIVVFNATTKIRSESGVSGRGKYEKEVKP